jgi:hypothetical protein
MFFAEKPLGLVPGRCVRVTAFRTGELDPDTVPFVSSLPE